MNRSRAKRFLGLTVAQILILGCMMLLFCGILGVGYWGLGALVSTAYESDGAILTAAVTSTFAPTFTPAPTETPLPTATLTPIPYESLIPSGWKQFKSDAAPGMEIWFPSSYEVVTENLMKSKNMNYIPPATPEAEQKGLKSVLNLIDLTEGRYTLYTTFGMSTQPMPAADLDKSIDQEFKNLIDAARLMERSDFVIGNYPARKVVFDATNNGVNAGLVAYLIQVDNVVWYLGFTTPYNDLYTLMPDFDKIVHTFRILPVTPTPPPTATVPSPTNTSLP